MRGTVRRVARLFLCPIFVMAAALAAPAADEQADRHRAEVEAFIKKADEIIHDNDYDVKTTAHYKVKTDDPRFDVAAAAQLLESFRVYFDEFWKGHAELLPYDEPARVRFVAWLHGQVRFELDPA